MLCTVTSFFMTNIHQYNYS